jgi:undecaprenyl-diphosphatase
MTWWHAVILGIVEGLTEYLPISSTYHLIVTARLLGLEQTSFLKMFEVVIQTGGIVPVAWYAVQACVKDRRLAKLVAVSFLPTMVFGLLLHQIVKRWVFEAPLFMTVVFVMVGVVFIWFERMRAARTLKPSQQLHTMSFAHAFWSGCGQVLAVIPGVSRSGAVIVTMMEMGFSRVDAARYSFVLAVPTLVAAAVLDVFKARELFMADGSTYVGLLALGFIAALVSAGIVTEWFLQFVRRHTLEYFGWYRIIVGMCLFLFLLASP